jgi:hypothetical protein
VYFKAIKQKIEAAERPLSVVVKLTMGGIVLTFSAAAYEEFKIVTMNYLKSRFPLSKILDVEL